MNENLVELLVGRCVCVHVPEEHGVARCGIEGCPCWAYTQRAQERAGVIVCRPEYFDTPRLHVFDEEESARHIWEKLRATGQGFQAEIVTVLWVDHRVKS